MVDAVAMVGVVAMADAFPEQEAPAHGVHMALNIPACAAGSADDGLACNICGVLYLAFYKYREDVGGDEGVPGHWSL